MKISDFHRGMRVKWHDDSGYVNFIGSQYITIVTREWETPETLHGVSQVNLICPSCYWDQIEVLEDKQ